MNITINGFTGTPEALRALFGIKTIAPAPQPSREPVADPGQAKPPIQFKDKAPTPARKCTKTPDFLIGDKHGRMKGTALAVYRVLLENPAGLFPKQLQIKSEYSEAVVYNAINILRQIGAIRETGDTGSSGSKEIAANMPIDVFCDELKKTRIDNKRGERSPVLNGGLFHD